MNFLEQNKRQSKQKSQFFIKGGVKNYVLPEKCKKEPINPCSNQNIFKKNAEIVVKIFICFCFNSALKKKCIHRDEKKICLVVQWILRHTPVGASFVEQLCITKILTFYIFIVAVISFTLNKFIFYPYFLMFFHIFAQYINALNFILPIRICGNRFYTFTLFLQKPCIHRVSLHFF